MTLVQDLKLRRGNRYDSAMEKISLCSENAKEYNSKNAQEIMNSVIKKLKDITNKSWTNTDKTSEVCKYLTIDKKDKEEFVENLIEEIRCSQEICIEYSLRATRTELEDNYLKDGLRHVSESSKGKYIDAINLLVRLEKIKLINEMEDLLAEIRKDLLSCIDYNDKIAKAEKEE